MVSGNSEYALVFDPLAPLMYERLVLENFQANFFYSYICEFLPSTFVTSDSFSITHDLFRTPLE